MNTQTERLEYLDSLRGIAALIVLVFHTNDYLFLRKFSSAYNENTVYTSRLFFNGIDAVSFFFVLSGFVLSYSYFKREENFNYYDYFLKRIFRIYPLYVFVLLLALAFKFTKNEAISYSGVVKEGLLFPNHPILLPHGWSLSVELVLSLLLPVFFILTRYTKLTYILPMLFICLFSYAFISIYLFHFILGLSLAYLYLNKSAFNFNFTKIKYLLLIVVMIFILHNIRHLTMLVPVLNQLLLYINYFIKLKILDISFYASAISSSAIIMMALHIHYLKKFLGNTVLTYLGKISYGIYLIHFILIYNILDIFNGIWNYGYNIISFILANIIVIALTIVTSSFTYYLIENPFIKLGKRLASFSFNMPFKKIKSAPNL